MQALSHFSQPIFFTPQRRHSAFDTPSETKSGDGAQAILLRRLRDAAEVRELWTGLFECTLGSHVDLRLVEITRLRLLLGDTSWVSGPRPAWLGESMDEAIGDVAAQARHRAIELFHHAAPAFMGFPGLPIQDGAAETFADTLWEISSRYAGHNLALSRVARWKNSMLSKMATQSVGLLLARGYGKVPTRVHTRQGRVFGIGELVALSADLGASPGAEQIPSEVQYEVLHGLACEAAMRRNWRDAIALQAAAMVPLLGPWERRWSGLDMATAAAVLERASASWRRICEVDRGAYEAPATARGLLQALEGALNCASALAITLERIRIGDAEG